jgi:hypothetical protein
MITEFAELVGLICHFRQEKGDREVLDHQRFVEWLEYHRHEELKNLIVNTAALRTEVDSLLRSDHAEMMKKLDQIGDIMVKLLGRMDEFRGLALAVAPNAQLSEQAILVLRQFVESGDDQFFYSNWGGGRWSLQLCNKGEQIGVLDPRFLADDLNQLAALQLLSVEYNSEGMPLYGITRNAVRFIETISASNSTSKSIQKSSEG